MIRLIETGDDVLLPIKALAGSKRNGITGCHDGRLKVAVTQAPEKGKANKAILQVLRDSLELKLQQLSVESGATQPRKVIRVIGMGREELQDRIRQLAVFSRDET